MLAQPLGECVGLAVGKQVHRAVGVHVDQYRAVHLPTAVTERVYRHELHPVLQEGAAGMDALFRERPQT